MIKSELVSVAKLNNLQERLPDIRATCTLSRKATNARARVPDKHNDRLLDRSAADHI